MKKQLSIVITGEVDHGKSSMVGRILEATGAIPESKMIALKKMCEEKHKEFEYAYLLDAFEEEQSQGITIDVSQIYFETPLRRYCIIDTPGHKEFLKNMISGSTAADAAILMIDAHEGIQEQSKRHAYLLNLIGITQLIVVINKMDLMSYHEAPYQKIVSEFTTFLKSFSFEKVTYLPMSAKTGANLSLPEPALSWYSGPTLIQALDQFSETKTSTERPLRFAVQDVYKFDERRIIVGKIESGKLSVGSIVKVAPSGERVTVASIETWSAPPKSVAEAGESIGITLTHQAFIERGNIITEAENPIRMSQSFQATLFWIGKTPLTLEASLTKKLKIHLLTQECEFELIRIEGKVNPSSLELMNDSLHEISKNEVAEVILKTTRPLALDRFKDIHESGRFVITEVGHVLGGGIIQDTQPKINSTFSFPETNQIGTKTKLFQESFLRSFLKATSWRLAGFIGTFFVVNWFTHDTRTAFSISFIEVFLKIGMYLMHERIWNQIRLGKSEIQPIVIWFTGLPSSGKSTLAERVSRELQKLGHRVEHLDGDAVRNIFPETEFTEAARNLHIKRIGFLAHKLSSQGIFVVASFVSPYAEGRDFVRKTCKRFIEIHVSTPLEVCEKRDVKGLYAKARRHEISNFTGVSAPYQAPLHPELKIDTSNMSIEACVNEIVSKIKKY